MEREYIPNFPDLEFIRLKRGVVSLKGLRAVTLYGQDYEFGLEFRYDNDARFVVGGYQNSLEATEALDYVCEFLPTIVRTQEAAGQVMKANLDE